MADKKFETLDGINSQGDVTISGNVAVDTDTLYVDSTNSRVGIGKTNPSQLLDIDGTATATLFSGAFSGNGASLTSVNATTLDGVDSTQFLRSDTTDTFTSGNLTFNGTALNITSGALRLSNNIILRLGTADSPGGALSFSPTGNTITLNGSNVNIDSGTLFVNTTNNRVGVNKTNPATQFDVAGRALANSFNSGMASVSPAATVNLNFTQNANFEITLNQSVTFTFTIDSTCRGQAGMIVINQDGTGGRTFVLPAAAKTPVGGASIVQQTDASSTSIINYFIVSASIVLVNYIGNFQ